MVRRPQVSVAVLAVVLLARAARPQEELGPQEPGPYGGCPRMCECSTWRELPSASCSGQRLYSVDTTVSNEVMALDLSNNFVRSLEDKQLSVSPFDLPSPRKFFIIAVLPFGALY